MDGWAVGCKSTSVWTQPRACNEATDRVPSVLFLLNASARIDRDHYSPVYTYVMYVRTDDIVGSFPHTRLRRGRLDATSRNEKTLKYAL
jgi:hypothetical protein